ncbi:MAG: glutamyl-tRNA reductase [Actinomycetes bacterium]|jgi:glutamyl-tRNA reductase|nr:glutamyl-tRNA reductase [Actinomycetes bacterium]
MQLTVVGLSHKTAPVDMRERVSFPADVQAAALHALLGRTGMLEALILSTCNRTEVYVVSDDESDGPAEVSAFIAEFHGLDLVGMTRYLYVKTGEDVVRHLFRVAASLDSMVVGEAQILGQLKEAYDYAFKEGATARIFNKLFRASFEVGKRVRSETAIGSSAVSISYAAIELAKRVFESLEGRRVLLLGAGEMSELTATHLQANGAGQVYVANRTFARAEELAAKFSGQAVPFEQRYEILKKVDIVVSATAAKDYIITYEGLAAAVLRRRDPLFMIDIAVPRDIDPRCGEYRNVYVSDVDALDGVVAANREERMREARRAEGIIEEEITGFEHWLEIMEVEPTIAALREQAETVREAELERALKRLGHLSEVDRETGQKLTQSITNKMLHYPTRKLREASGGRKGIATIETARYLYGLEDKADGQQGFRLIQSLLGRRPRSADVDDL